MQNSNTSRLTLIALAEEHISSLIRDAVSVQRHCKRAHWHEGPPRPCVRRRLHAADINLALQMRGSEKLYGTPKVSPDPQDTERKVDLEEFLRRDNPVGPPSEVGLRTHWIAVDGKQPDYIHENNLQTMKESENQTLLVQQLQTAMLSEELQLYFKRATLAIERGSQSQAGADQQDSIIQSISKDPGIQELVPFFVRYCQQELYKHAGNVEHCRTLIRVIGALLRNPNIHLELQLQELLPVLITCVVANQLSDEAMNHWALRRDAAAVLVSICNKYGDEYSTLKSKMLPTFVQAVAQNRPASQFGGMTAITLFGPKAIDSFLIPALLANWKNWERTAATSEDGRMCLMAALSALGSFLYYADDAEKASRISWSDLEIFGNAVVPITGAETEYNMCFI